MDYTGPLISYMSLSLTDAAETDFLRPSARGKQAVTETATPMLVIKKISYLTRVEKHLGGTALNLFI